MDRATFTPAAPRTTPEIPREQQQVILGRVEVRGVPVVPTPVQVSDQRNPTSSHLARLQ